MIDDVERQERDIAVALNSGIDHFVAYVLEWELDVLHRCHSLFHRFQSIDGLFRSRVEIRYSRGIKVDVALRVQRDPAVKRRTLQGHELFEQGIHRASSFESGHGTGRNESTRPEKDRHTDHLSHLLSSFR